MAKQQTKAQAAKQAAQEVEAATEAPEQTAAQPPEAEAATAGAGEQRAEKSGEAKRQGKARPATKAGMVEAKLLARHCEGGRCKEAGETMRMTRGTYERLKHYGRVE